MKKTILRTAAAMLMLCIVACGVGCGSGIEQPEWLKQAICEHDFNEKVIIKEPTCTESGSAQKFCSKCGKEKMIIQKALGHTEIVDEEIAATCTQPGLTAGSHCSVCGVVMVKQEEVFGIHVDDDKNTLCDVCNISITPTGFNAEVGDLYAGEPIVGNFYRVYRNTASSSLNLSNLKDNDLERLYIDSKSGPYWNKAFIFNSYPPGTTNEAIVFYETDYIDFYFEDRIYTNDAGSSFTVTAETCFVEYGDLEIYRLNVGAKESCSLGAHNFAKWTTTVEPTCSTEGEKSRTCTLCAAQQSKQIETLEHVDADKDLSCDECNITLPETTHYQEVRKYDNTTDTVAGNWWRIYFGAYNAVCFTIRDDNTINISSNYYSTESTFGVSAYTPAGLSITNVQYCQYQGYIDIYFDSSISYKSPNWDTGITVAETATFDFTDGFSVYLIEPEG